MSTRLPSDTPRTDAEEIAPRKAIEDEWVPDYCTVPADFARTLERENTKLRTENIALRDNFQKAANVIRALVIEAGGTVALSDRSLAEAYGKDLIEHRDEPGMLYKLSVR